MLCTNFWSFCCKKNVMEETVKIKSIKGTAWSLIDNISSQGFSFVVGIVLARLLTPKDFGTIGVLAIFIAISNVFVECGFGNALIRKKDRSQEDLSTAFFFNLVVGCIVYLILFLIAPLVAYFFKLPILTSLLRVLAFCIVFNSLSIVQNAVLTANLKIKTQAIINFFTQIPMGCVGVYFAYKGYGVWTLVIQQVGASFLRFLWLWFVAKWHPSKVFSHESFHYLFNFGWKLLGANLLGTFFNEIYGFVIGRFLGASDLGYYSKSKQLSEHPRSLINNVINRVVLPMMVESQGDDIKVRDVYRRLTELICFLAFPFFGLLILIAEPIIIIIWTDKWKESIILFQFFCVGMALGPVSTLNFCLLQVLNRTDVMLKLEFLKKPICLLMLIVSIPFGLKGIVFISALYNIVATIINIYPTYSLINYPIKKQITDIFRYFFVVLIINITLYYPLSLVKHNLLWIVLGILTYPILYFYICKWLSLRGFVEASTLITMRNNKYAGVK